MAKSRAEEMAQLRKDFIEAEKSKSGLESKQQSLQEQKNTELAALAAKNIKFEDIDARILEAETKVDLVIAKMNSVKTGNQTEVAV